ncbi:MAG: TIGR00159 family protein [Sandaracinaceae bacterium]|nr:TIGR00159 family protein [Sandaracinaceae bacterium]
MARDVFDIFIVAFIVYRVLLLLRGTRAMQMGVGLLMILVIYEVARFLDLMTLYALLDGIVASIVIIVVVVFQNDIRRALMRFGRRPFLRAVRTAEEGEVIEEVIKAAHMLGQKRVGALIVFERDATLDEFIEEGTTLDAKVSTELLYSVFIPSFENPMHDGAVVIRDQRVWQAGAFLPLTASPKLDKTLGTRHRAAIGITEETDAVVVVVSEERGAVSLCFNGNMVRNLDPNSLREALLGLFYQKKAGKRPTVRPESTARVTIPATRGSVPPPPSPSIPPAPRLSEDTLERIAHPASQLGEKPEESS